MIGILYESDEWSDWHLHAELEKAVGEPVRMIDMRHPSCIDAVQDCDLLVSRVFASAVFRGNHQAAARMLELVDWATREQVAMVNAPGAHRFEISKAAAAQALAANNLTVPRIQGLGTPNDLHPSIDAWDYPCVIKPDCGGRTTHTAVLHNANEAGAFLKAAPQIPFIVEDHIQARANFVTRIELVDGAIALIVKRSIAQNGLSSYHEGSIYESYPDCPDAVQAAVLKAGALLGIAFGSFDVIEAEDGVYLIDANSVSNVSEDCTDMFGMDLMKTYAAAIARRYRQHDLTRRPLEQGPISRFTPERETNPS